MKNLILSVIGILFLGFGIIEAQKILEIHFMDAETAFKSAPEANPSTPNWHENWSKESLKEISKITEKHGTPFEIGNSYIFWQVKGKNNQTIHYSENFSFEINKKNTYLLNDYEPIKYVSLVIPANIMN